MDRIVAEHQQFSQSVKDLQDWVDDAVHMLDSYCHPTADKSVLDSRMLKLEVWKQESKTCSLQICIKNTCIGYLVVAYWSNCCSDADFQLT